MAKKVLYLGNGRWCYTPSCKQHQALIQAKDAYVSAVEGGDEKAIEATKDVLTTTPEGESTYNYLKTQQLKEELGRAPLIALDLDGTTGDFTDALRQYVAGMRAAHVPREQWKEMFPNPDQYSMWKATDAWFTDSEDFVTQFRAAENAGLYTTLTAYPGSSKTLQELVSYGFKVKVVTARDATFNHHTSAWLEQEVIPHIEIHNPGEEKHKVLVDVYVDDAPRVIANLLDKGKKVVIMPQEYNETMPAHENARRVKGWDKEVASAIFDLLDKKDQ